ncbi:unnamed protein product [Hymenolepis diminuta]|uniref:G_PROTEIN_RECEP_F1_2 domain-containing protein n=1 Tax=Hymenolepis diminuta TaxID=6216 RepID=A0A0R3SGB2_HYMDI|nr:unnamed protein product [Hymenolepis diminuta]
MTTAWLEKHDQKQQLEHSDDDIGVIPIFLSCLPARQRINELVGKPAGFIVLLAIFRHGVNDRRKTSSAVPPLISHNIWLCRRGTYYCVNMFLVTLSTFLCLIVVNCHFRGDSHSELPQWAKMLFLVYGARIFFINSGTAKSTSASPSNAVAMKSNNTGGGGGGSSGGYSRRAAEVSLAEAAHTDKLMRSSAAADRSAYRSTCQSPPGTQMGRYHIRDSFRGRQSTFMD